MAQPQSWTERCSQASARIDSQQELRWMVEEVVAQRFEMVADQIPDDQQIQRFDHMVSRCSNGEPLQYIFGHWQFRHLDLMVDPRVLIPRPETEQLVEVGLKWLSDSNQSEPVVVDLGTGSGAIALSIATESANTRIWATDNSTDALAVAKLNLNRIIVDSDRVTLLHGSWWDAIPPSLLGKVDLCISNPPYIAAKDVAGLNVAKHEPMTALSPGELGTEAIAQIVSDAQRWLSPDGLLAIEIGSDQASEVEQLALEAGLGDVRIQNDLAGVSRMLLATRGQQS